MHASCGNCVHHLALMAPEKLRASSRRTACCLYAWVITVAPAAAAAAAASCPLLCRILDHWRLSHLLDVHHSSFAAAAVAFAAATYTFSPAGSWSIGGFGSCIACPSGSTSDPMAASPYDCTTCLPGWGSTAGDAGTGSPQDSNFETCTACEYGFYSPGGTGACVACDDG